MNKFYYLLLVTFIVNLACFFRVALASDMSQALKFCKVSCIAFTALIILGFVILPGHSIKGIFDIFMSPQITHKILDAQFIYTPPGAERDVSSIIVIDWGMLVFFIMGYGCPILVALTGFVYKIRMNWKVKSN